MEHRRQMNAAQRRMVRLLPHGSRVTLAAFLDLISSVQFRWVTYQNLNIYLDFGNYDLDDVEYFVSYMDYLKENGGGVFNVTSYGIRMDFAKRGGQLKFHIDFEEIEQSILEQLLVSSQEPHTVALYKDISNDNLINRA